VSGSVLAAFASLIGGGRQLPVPFLEFVPYPFGGQNHHAERQPDFDQGVVDGGEVEVGGDVSGVLDDETRPPEHGRVVPKQHGQPEERGLDELLTDDR